MTHGLGSSKLDQELFKLLYNETLDYKGHPDLESRSGCIDACSTYWRTRRTMGL